MSDVNDWIDVPAPAAAPATAAAPVDDWMPVGAPPVKGFSDRMSDDATKIGDEAVTKLQNPNLNDLGRAAIDAQTGISYMMSAPKEGVVGAYNSLPESIRNAASSGTEMAKQAVAKGWQSLPESARTEISSDASAAKKWIGSLMEEHPNTAGVLGVAADTALAGQGVRTAAKYIPDAVEALKAARSVSPMDLLKNEASGTPDTIPTPKAAPVASFNPASVHESISNEYGKALGQSKQLYKQVRDIGNGLDVPVDGLRQHLDDVIKEIGDDPLHEGKSALSDLKRIRAKIGDGAPSKILDANGNPMNRALPDVATASDLLDIKQFLNENFNRKRFAERADNPYSSLSKAVKTGLNEVSDMHPPFGDALKTADKFWVNGVDLPYRSNDVLHRFWTPEDYNAMESVKRGMADRLPDITRERQYTMLKKLNNPIEFEAMRNALPPDAQKAFAQALGQYIKEDSGFTPSKRLKNFVKGAFHVSDPSGLAWGKPVTGLREIGKAVEPEFTPEQADIMKSIEGKPYARGGAVVDKNPTPAQKMAGNYKKHHIRFHGLDISIENPKGSERSGESKNGKKWSSTMPDHYGYIKRTQGADGDHVDVYVGENERSNRVYVIDQKDADTGAFDEHKVMLGYGTREDAVAAYRSAFSDKKDRIMKVVRLSISEFKDWLKNGNTKQPVKKVA